MVEVLILFEFAHFTQLEAVHLVYSKECKNMILAKSINQLIDQ